MNADIHPAAHTDTAVLAPPPGSDAYEGFAVAVLALHDILPAAGGHPTVCRACDVPPGDCPVWALAQGFLGITWEPAGPAG